MKKRFLSIVLAVLMLVGIMPISAIAADAEPPESNITAVKSAQWVEGRESEGIAKVTIQVSGKAPEEWTVTDPTDIVLVMDRSLSMDDKATSNDRYDKMTQAKNAAKQFAQKMLESDKVRIAVVMYTKTAQTVKGQNQDAFSNAYATVENRINSITTEGVSSENSGTNTQAGIHAARELLKASTAKNKIMIVLSDGQPNYSFPFVATADYVGCERWFKSACEDNGPRNGYITNIGSFIVDYNSYINEYGGFNLNYGNARITVKCKEHGTTTENFDYGVYNGSTYNGKTGKTDHSVATIWEAGQAEKESVEIYSIGFGIGSNQNAIKTMKGIASAKTEDHYFSAGMSANDIEAVFNSIAKQVSKYVAYKPIVTDTISNDFEYYTDATLMASAGEGDTITPNGQTVTWDLAAEQLDTTEHTLTFYVKYKNIDNPAAPNTNLPTNAGAQLKYAKEENGQATETQNIANASVPSLSKTVSYIVTGQAPSGYTKPDDAYVWVGHEYTVADVPETASAEEGTYTFEGWKANGEPASSELEITADITLTGEWKFEAAPTTMDITITKIWDDSVPTDRDRSVRIWLYANGEQDKYFYAKKGAGITDNTTTGTIPDRPVKDADGKDIEYTVKEIEINGQAVTSDNQLVTEDEIWTGVVTGDAKTGFTVTNSVRKNERYGVEVTKTATRDRILANGTTETVDLVNEVSVVRADDVIHYTVTIENTGNVAFGAGDRGQDNFTAVGTLIGEDGNIEGGKYGDIKGVSTLEPGSSVTKYYTYKVLPGDEERGRIANNASAQIKTGPGVDDTIRGLAAVNVKVEKPHGVTYTFENYDNLPTEVQNLLPTQDAKKYYKGDSVTLPTLTENTKTIDGIKYTFAGWHVGSTEYEAGGIYTMDDKDVTFVGKWNSVTVNPKYKLSYVFKSGDDTITTLPENVLSQNNPAYSDEVEAGTDVTLPSGFTEVTDTVNKGKWTFVGWYTDDNLSAESKITGDTYPMPEGGKTLYGKWTFEADKPEITEAGYTVEYYRQDADGENYTLQEDTDSGVAEIGKEKTIEPAEDKYSGYTYNETESIVTLTIQEEADKNVFKVYYDAVPGLTVAKTITDVTRDGEPLDPTDPEVEVKEGDVIEYEITVKNSGKLNLTDVVLTDEFTGAEGDLNIISGDDYTVDGYEITLKNGLNVGNSVTIKATYEVQLGDSGYEISNKAIGAAKDALKREVTGESRPVGITPDALKAYRIFGSAYKYVKSEKGTFNKDGETVTFEFKVTSDKKGEEILDTFTIDVDETVKAGETSEGDWGGFDFNLSEEEFENLDKKEFNGKEYPVVYLWELKGDLKNMSYSTKRITLYLDRPNISYYSAREPMVEYLGTRMAYADPDKGADADIINIYGKQSSSGGTVKVGPQLNRDDHVAYIMGYPDGTVQPKGEITRAEACTIFFRLLTESSRDYYFSKTNDYTDVNAGDWFNNAISTLSNAGIVTGYNDGTFRPNQPITRGEMAKIIANFANLSKGGKTFSDLYGHWSKTYVELAAGNGWIAGYPDGSFRPDQKITRAETVTMINRVLERVPAKELRLLSRSIMLTFPDNNPGDWYYIAIQEASNSHEYQRSVYETTGDEMWTKLIDNVDWTKLEK